MNSTVIAQSEHPSKERSSRIVVFFLLVYAITWPCFLLVATSIPASTILGKVLLFLGTFSPSLVAIFLTSREGSTAAGALLGRIFLWRVGFRWYLFAAGYIAIIKLLVALLHRLITGTWPRFGNEAWYLMIMAMIFSTPVQAGEEIGWRGYALPRMAERMGFASASVLLGVIWAVWHLPLFFVSAVDNYHQTFFLYAFQVTALSVAIAWLYARTNGSLLLTMLLHAAVNNTKDIVPSAIPGGTNTFGFHASLVAWLTVGLLWLCAAYFLMRMPRSPQALSA